MVKWRLSIYFQPLLFEWCNQDSLEMWHLEDISDLTYGGVRFTFFIQGLGFKVTKMSYSFLSS